MDHLQQYENVGHVLEVLSQMHADIAGAISALADQAQDERQKMILGYLAEHQAERATALAAYQRDCEATLLKQWFQIPFPEDPQDLLESIRAFAPDTVTVEQLLSEIDRFMDLLLPHLRDRAETANVKAVFQGLLDIEDRERHLRTRALGSFSQI